MSIDTLATERLSESARLAVETNWVRLERARSEADVETTIGSAKDLVECVCKVVIDGLGGTYGSREDLPALGSQALKLLEAHPSTFQDRDPLRHLVRAAISLPAQLATLRNLDGAGHGRSSISDLVEPNAEFVGDLAFAWVKWCLRANDRILKALSRVSEAEEAIVGGSVFHAGEVKSLLEELDLDHLEPKTQHRVGLAVGRRAASETFNISVDVLEPIAEGKDTYPPEFIVGIVEGLFLDVNGRARSIAWSLRGLATMVEGLGDTGLPVLEGLIEKTSNADIAYPFKADKRLAVVQELQKQAQLAETPEVSTAMGRLASVIGVSLKEGG